MPDFVHLHVHTQYSILDGAAAIKPLIKRAKALGMNAIAITDHGNMYGVKNFHDTATDAGVKPILGCEVYVVKNRFEKDKDEKAGDHLILLAKNLEGYHNLCKMVSYSFTEGFYYKPRIDKQLIEQYHEGLICCSACLGGEVPQAIMHNDIEEAERVVQWFKNIFGEDYYLELQLHPSGDPQKDADVYENQLRVNKVILELAAKYGVKYICSNDVHFILAEDAVAHDHLICLNTGRDLDDPNRMRYTFQEYLKSPEEMAALFPDHPEALATTLEIADKCEDYKLTHAPLMPNFPPPEDFPIALGELRESFVKKIEDEEMLAKIGACATVPELEELVAGDKELSDRLMVAKQYCYLKDLTYKGAHMRYGDVLDEKTEERIKYELSTIEWMGFPGYFLIVWDFINYARENGIPVGPGRGSAAGSIVSYCLHITNIDPIRYSLLFERFLNPERVSMPDIDIDFCYERRQEVIDYVGRKYGKEKVVQIVTFGTLAAKGVIRDVGRVMDLPYSFVDSIAKMIPNELNMTIDKALSMNAELRKLYESDEQVHVLIDMSKRLEGLPRHTSMHAAGVVICPEAADHFVPLSRGSDGSITTQFTMTTLEELGLLKMDFLGLRTLTVIDHAVKMIEHDTGVKLDMEHLDYNDKKVLYSLCTGRTDGVFQLESGGMKSFMKELKPQNLEDIIAGISLYRPGPMDFIPKYIKGKNNHDEITYSCPELEPILSPTYGCIVYQEQVMQIVRDLGGYTMGRSDLVRRAMSKKKQSVMEKERANFVYGNPEEGVPGCVARGIPEKVGLEIYAEMMDFAKYAFNKSHAACYAVVAYQTAYLKYYYPVEFMASLMTSVIDNPGKVAEYILVCRQMGIAILPPDINEGEPGFSVSGKSIRYGLTAIKGVGHPVADAVIAERKQRGVFKNLQDFLSRMSDTEVNKRNVENFIKAGAFDSLEGTRKQFMSVFVQLMDQNQQNRKNNMAGQLSLFDLVDESEKKNYEIRFPDVGEYSKEILLTFEKEVLGVYVSGHPLQEYEQLWRRNISNTTADFMLDEETNSVHIQDGAKAVIGGIIEEKKIKYTKNDKVMAFLQVEDLVGTIEVIVFPKTYEQYGSKLMEDEKVLLRGRVPAEEDKDAKLICESVQTFDEIPKKLWIKFPTMEAYQQQEKKLLSAIAASDGKDTVVIYVENPRAMKQLGANQTVHGDEALLKQLEELFGEENVKLM